MIPPLGFVLAACLVLMGCVAGHTPVATPTLTLTFTPMPTPTATFAEPFMPTAPPMTPSPTPNPGPTAVVTPRPTRTMTSVALSAERQRFGAVALSLTTYDLMSLNTGWFSTNIGSGPPLAGVDLLYVVHADEGESRLPLEQLSAFVRSRPGAIWQVGNEPDIYWQSNCTPEQYARVYQKLYQLIKRADPTALVAAGAIAQPTPLRRLYLDLVLHEYWRLYHETMPVDVWTIHVHIVREERDTWGADIPPGLANLTGQLYGIQDNDRLDIFQELVVDFRTWMELRGYRERPLIITEFSVLMPAVYGFDTERVGAFMSGAFDFMLSAVDERTGYPADGNRLVQRWAWYSVADPNYPAGNLFDPETGQMTPLGRVFAGYAAPGY